MTDQLFIDNTGVVELNGLTNGITGAFINDAVVQCTLYLKDEEVAGQTWPLTLDYVADSSGDYRGLLDSALELTDNRTYTATVVATSGGMQGEWNCRVVAKERPCE